LHNESKLEGYLQAIILIVLCVSICFGAVVDTQRAALDAERQQTQLNGQRAISMILLAKALGGGWQPASTAHLACSK